MEEEWNNPNKACAWNMDIILCPMFKSNIKPQEIRGHIQIGHSHMNP